MSIFDDKSLKSVADAAAKIMAEKLHPNQQVLDVHEPEKDKLTAKDFEMLRKGKKASDVKKEEVEQVEEGWDDMMKAVKDRAKPQPSGGAGMKQGSRYGGSKQKDEPEAKEEPKKKKLKESFTSMLEKYDTEGLKAFASLQEEPDNEQFTKELKDQIASMEGKKKQPSVAAPSTQGVKQMPEEVEVLDADEVNGVKIDTIEERTMTEPEKKKKEEIVKSMKKGMKGFKERYGERAKEVMYATATKQAMKD